MANRRTERCSTQFTIGEPQIKTMRHNYVATGSSQTKPLTRPNADGNALLQELSIAGEMQNGTGPLEDSMSSSVEHWTDLPTSNGAPRYLTQQKPARKRL